MAAESEQLDTCVAIVAPENIAFDHRLAGPFRRLPAYLMDLVIRALVLAAVSVVAMVFSITINLGGFSAGAVLVAYFALDWLYGGLFEALWNGQTPGKRMMRLRVLTIDGQPINAMQAVLRNVLRAVDALPMLGALPTYSLGLVSTALTDRFQRLGDLACGTMVVVEDRPPHYGLVQIHEPEAIRLAGLLPANVQVSRGLARALSAYVQRRQLFSWPRRVEIASRVGELLRVKYDLPRGTNHDMLLCAVYYRVFIAGTPSLTEATGSSPFAAGPPGRIGPRPGSAPAPALAEAVLVSESSAPPASPFAQREGEAPAGPQ